MKNDLEKLLEFITIKIPSLSADDIDKIKQQGGIDARSVYSIDLNLETKKKRLHFLKKTLQ